MPLHGLFAGVYRRFLRPLFPNSPIRMAGVVVPGTRYVGDRVIGRLLNVDVTQDQPLYEAALVRGLRACVRPGDHVVVVGGGMGVTTTLAALLSAPTGHVVCFEGGSDAVENTRKTAKLNKVNDRVTVVHGFVGLSDHITGSSDGARDIPIEELPECDVLEMDCEGSETLILQVMTIRPRAIVVECHAAYGAPVETISKRLQDLGYHIENLGVAEPAIRQLCEDAGIYVLMANKLAR